MPDFHMQVALSNSQAPDKRISRFLKTQQKTRAYFQTSLSTPSLSLEKDLPRCIQAAHTISMSKENLTAVLAIAKNLRTQEGVKNHLDQPQRFKIDHLCSITLLKSTLWIHLKKKKKYQHLLGQGSFSSFFTSFKVTNARISLVAEGTTYLSTNPPINLSLEQLKKLSQSVVLPDIDYPYRGNELVMPILALKAFTDKQCRIFPLYHADLAKVLTYHHKTQCLPSKRLWKMMYQAVKSCKDLHANNLIHRDIKPHNYLVKFSITKKGIDWTKPKLLLADLDMVTSAENAALDWMGTSMFWPPNTSKLRANRQSFGADLYALGETLRCFTKAIPSEELPSLQQLVDYAKTYNDANPPTIEGLYERLTNYLKAHYPKIL